jgi:Heparinase II/III-like protein/Heparinase II/III N-terminus
MEMGWDELRVRTRQEFAKRWDLVLSRIGGPLLRQGRVPQSKDFGRFFFTPAELPGILTYLRERLSDIVEGIVNQADQIREHRFDLLGYEAVDYGTRIDWHLDPVHGKRAPRRPWFRMPYLDFDHVGDAKVIWELSRQQHLVTLAKAYRLTGEPVYVQELFRQWYDWQEQNPYGIGINWASSLEVAFRSLSWLWVWHLLNGCSVVPERFSFDLLRALALNARHISRFLSTYFSPNTHLLGEGVGLFFIGTLCPDLPSARSWQARGWKIVLSEAQRQVRPDGMHFEQSLYYHVYAVDFFLHARILAHVNGIPVPVQFDETIEKMLDVISAMGKAGPLPRFGDDDGGRLFDSRRNRAGHLLDPLATGAVLFDRPDFKAVTGRVREESVWLLGIQGVNRFEKLPSTRPPESSFCLEPSGIYVMANSKPVQSQLVIDVGPQQHGRLGHRHADALSVQLTVGGKMLLIDPGTFVYVDSARERDWFRGTAAHNTIQVDRLHQVESAGPFHWKSVPCAKVDCWMAGENFNYFVGSHSGYQRLSDPVRHTRTVFRLKSSFWLVRDVLEGSRRHHLQVSWHFAPGSISTIPGGATFLADNQAALTVLFNANQNYSQRIVEGWYSPVYGRKRLSPVLQFSTEAELPAEFVTLLIPVLRVNTSPRLLQAMEAGRNSVRTRAYQFSTSGNANYLFFFAGAPGRWEIGSWTSDARFLFCSASADDSPRHMVICDGTFVEVRGQRVFNSAKGPVRGEWYSSERADRFFSIETTATCGFATPPELQLANICAPEAASKHDRMIHAAEVAIERQLCKPPME